MMQTRKIKVEPTMTGDENIEQDKTLQNGQSSVCALETVCRPIILMLNYFGMTMNGFRLCLKDVAYVTYILVRCALIYVDTIRYLSSFQEKGVLSDGFMRMCVYAVIYVFNALYYPVYVVSISRNLKPMFDAFGKYQSRYNFSFDTNVLRRRVRVTLVLFTLFIIVSFSFTCPLLIVRKPMKYGPLTETILHPFGNVNSSGIGTYIAITSIIYFRYEAVLVAFCLFGILLVTGNAIKQEFRRIKKHLTNLLKNKDSSQLTISAIEEIRLQHEEVTSLLQHGNAVFHHIVFSVYIYGLPTLCFILYGLVHDSLTRDDLFLMSFYLVVNAFYMFALTHWGATINSEAHEPRDLIFNIDMTSLPDKVLHQIQIFLSRLCVTQIGISVYGLFVVDSTTKLMLLGTLITYAFVVIQLKPNDTPNCNVLTPTNNHTWV